MTNSSYFAEVLLIEFFPSLCLKISFRLDAERPCFLEATLAPASPLRGLPVFQASPQFTAYQPFLHTTSMLALLWGKS